MRPTGKPCAVCAKTCALCARLRKKCSEVGDCEGAPILTCEHLENVYDYATQVVSMSEQDLVEYGLNRMLALNRDNGNKRVGKLPSRRYRSNLDRHDDAVAKARARLNRHAAGQDQEE